MTWPSSKRLVIQKLSIASPPSTCKDYWLEPLPSRNSGLASYFPYKVLAFEITHLLRISNNLPQDGYEYFLELHTPEPGSGCDLVIIYTVLLSPLKGFQVYIFTIYRES